jgi:hypothetical protein
VEKSEIKNLVGLSLYRGDIMRELPQKSVQANHLNYRLKNLRSLVVQRIPNYKDVRAA